MNYSARAFRLTVNEYNYLLIPLKKKLIKRDGIEWYSIISDNIDDTTDILNRLKGLYDFYGDLHPILVYKCSKNGSFIPFREYLGIETIY